MFFGTLQELNKFNCKAEFHLIAKYWNCSNSSVYIKLEHGKIEHDPYIHAFM